MPALERPGKHRDVEFVVRLNSEPGRRMRWTFTADRGLTETGVTTYGVEAAFKAGLDAAEVAIDVALDGNPSPGMARKKSANDWNWTEYGVAVDALKAAIAAWARDSSEENRPALTEARSAADLQAKIFFRSLDKAT